MPTRGAPNPGMLSELLPYVFLSGAAWFLFRTPPGGQSLFSQWFGSMAPAAPLPPASSMFAAPAAPAAPAPIPGGVGRLNAVVTLDGVEVSATLYVSSSRPVPLGPENNVPITPPGGADVPPGDYTYTYVSGGPPGSILKNVSLYPDPTSAGPYAQHVYVAPGSVHTIYFNFATYGLD